MGNTGSVATNNNTARPQQPAPQPAKPKAASTSTTGSRTVHQGEPNPGIKAAVQEYESSFNTKDLEAHINQITRGNIQIVKGINNDPTRWLVNTTDQYMHAALTQTLFTYKLRYFKTETGHMTIDTSQVKPSTEHSDQFNFEAKIDNGRLESNAYGRQLAQAHAKTPEALAWIKEAIIAQVKFADPDCRIAENAEGKTRITLGNKSNFRGITGILAINFPREYFEVAKEVNGTITLAI